MFLDFSYSKECKKCGGLSINKKLHNTYDANEVRYRSESVEFILCRCIVCGYSYDTKTKDSCPKEQPIKAL